MSHVFFRRTTVTLAAFLGLSCFAQAHPGHGHGFAHGFTHPLHGFDHLLAMLAVGLWASQLGGRARWAVPAAFAGVMAVGGALGMAGAGLPFAEAGIVASVLTLGLLIAAAVRLPLAAGVALVGIFALFHGSAHGAEMPKTADGFAYGLGFMATAVLLQAGGFSLGVLMQRVAKVEWLRAGGVAVSAAGVLLLWN